MPLGLKYHIADISDGNAKGVDLPVLWHIPKTGGSSMKVLLAQCRDLAVASQVGVALERRRGNLGQDQLPESLYYVTNGKKSRYVSVDVSTKDGLAKAKELKLLDSGLADVVITPLITTASIEMFSSDPGQRARVFSIFRHPVDRAVSKFYYLQEATWEPTYDPTLKDMTIEEFAAGNKDEVNFMVSMLNNDPSVIDERHLEIAKEVLREKVLVGLQSDMEESARRFFSHFEWKKDDDDWNPCEKRILFKGGVNSNKHSKVEEETKAWKLLALKNSLDIQLYEYAVELFHEQGQLLFGSDTDVGKKIHKPVVHSKAAAISSQVKETLRGVMELDIERQLKNGEYPTSKSPSQSQSDAPSSTPSDDPSNKPSAVPFETKFCSKWCS